MKYLTALLFYLCYSLPAFTQHEIELNHSGLILPRLNQQEIDTLSAVDGQVVYNKDRKRIEYYNIHEDGNTFWASLSNAIVDDNLQSAIYFLQLTYKGPVLDSSAAKIAIIQIDNELAFQFQKDSTYDGTFTFSNNDGNIVIKADPVIGVPAIPDNYEDNIFIGAGAGHPNLEGDQNVMIGTLAGSGARQRRTVMLGYRAGKTTIQNSDNTIIGLSLIHI